MRDSPTEARPLATVGLFADLRHRTLPHDQKKPTDQQRLNKLESSLTEAHRLIEAMRMTGGFGDSKLLSVRSTKIEERCAALELDNEMLLDVNAHLVEALHHHLGTRHSVDVVRDNTQDTIGYRKIIRRMFQWTEAKGLLKRRRDVVDTRRDENRIRPAAATA